MIVQRSVALIISFLILVGFTKSGFAFDINPIGARYSAMANTGVSFGNSWSLFNNQAGLALNGKTMALCGYRNNFYMKELSEKAFGFTKPLFGTNVGFSLEHFGFSLYNQKKVGLAIAKQISANFYAAVQLDYFNVHISESDNKRGSFTGEIGLLAKVTDKLWFGSHIFNPFVKKAKDSFYENQPSILKMGMSYIASKSFQIAIEAEKDLEREIIAKCGAEYIIREVFAIRAGISSKASLNSFGIGVHLKKWNADFAFQRHPILGFSSELSLSFEIGKSNEPSHVN